MGWAPGFLRRTSAFLQPLKEKREAPCVSYLTKAQKTRVGMPCSRSTRSMEKAYRWQPLAISSTPIPCQTAWLQHVLSCGMVWLEYFMLLQAALPQLWQKCMHPAQNPNFPPFASTLNLAFLFLNPIDNRVRLSQP